LNRLDTFIKYNLKVLYALPDDFTVQQFVAALSDEDCVTADGIGLNLPPFHINSRTPDLPYRSFVALEVFRRYACISVISVNDMTGSASNMDRGGITSREKMNSTALAGSLASALLAEPASFRYLSLVTAFIEL
jgi:hypothetical protein